MGKGIKEGLLIYGCYGYTGQLISKHAKEEGLRVTIAGRNEDKVKEQAKTLQLPYLAFDLENHKIVEEKIKDFKVVLHCAGPFSHTSKPMVDACLKTGTHYLDITGEYQVFEEIFKRDTEALSAKVLLMPGVGFDVVPSDCLAAYLKAELPTATNLELALYHKGGQLSHGTAITVAENLGESGMVRRSGQLTPLANGSLTRFVNFDKRGDRKTVAIPWGDISTAFRSTGIPNITVYNAVPQKVIDSMKFSNYIGFIFRWGFVKKYLIGKIKQRPAGPNQEERASSKTYIWGEASNPIGISKSAVLELPDGYTLTYLTAVKIAELVMKDTVPFGAKTPSEVFGKDFILQFKEVSRTDLL